MSYNPYGQDYGRSNPYAQQTSNQYGNGYGQQYAPQYNSRYNDVEMAQYNGYTSQPASDPNSMLNECQAVTDGAASIDGQLESLKMAQRKALNEADTNSASNREIDRINTNIMSEYKSLIERMKRVKSRPESQYPQNKRQIERAERALKDAYGRYRVVENDYQKRMREQIERQYRIARPDAPEDEVRRAAEEPNQQVFAQALLQSDRRGESRQVLSAVRDRHAEIHKIEQQMIELAQLFKEMEEMVVQQEVLVQNVEQKAMDTTQYMEEGNQQLGVATETARKTRRKKWICLGISVAIVIILIIIIAVAVAILT